MNELTAVKAVNEIDSSVTQQPHKTAPTVTSTPSDIEVKIAKELRAIDEMLMLQVPAGIFPVGQYAGEIALNMDANPPLEMYLDDFWIDQLEVSNAQYSRCIEAGVCQETPYEYDLAFKRPNYPAVAVSKGDAEAYCGWVDGRLPSEEEWRYAAGGAQGLIYPWGNEFAMGEANFCDKQCPYPFKNTNYDDGSVRTAPVGSYPNGASWVGAMDMSGNVWEWVKDWYPENYYEGSAFQFPSDAKTDGLAGSLGGSWLDDNYGLRISNRLVVVSNYRSTYIGFRCVSDVKP
ncbi:MAG: SUMF1/EgtB/PvdO family nonheme iron enzyme [Anaerolineales bacterium]|nr:SUMF1/EgtB/PvdO family nonheme iron enzyme [Anaerolineales bacterium]